MSDGRSTIELNGGMARLGVDSAALLASHVRRPHPLRACMHAFEEEPPAQRRRRSRAPINLFPMQTRVCCLALGALTRLTELSLENWTLTDGTASCLAGLKQLKKLSLGRVSQLSAAGFHSLASLTALTSLWMSEVASDNAALAPLSALSALRFLRAELASGYGDSDLGPLAALPGLHTFGW